MERLRARLTNYTRRNKELYFKKSRLSVELKELNIAADELFKKDSITLAKLDESLHKKINKIRLSDKKFQREFGLSGAWLLGPFICWRSSASYNAEDLLISPIFRLPINIEQTRSKTIKISLEDDTKWINPSLRLFLKHSWGIELPEHYDGDFVSLFCEQGKSIAQLNQNVLPTIPPRTKAVRDEDGYIIGREPVDYRVVLPADELEYYNLTTNDCFLLTDTWVISQINASRAALVEDYDRMENCHLVDNLLEGKSQKIILPDLNLDTIPESNNKFIAQIDSSQHLAAACAGDIEGLVIQGPPGTGKSQTITNIISRLVSEGKSVLFVSEKRAALDVVYSRLEKGGISNLATLLHSSELNKSELYKTFIDSLEAVPESSAWQSVCQELELAKSDVREYHQALNVIHKSGLSNAEILTRATGQAALEVSDLRFTHSELKTACENLNVAQGVIQESFYLSSPWLNKAKFVTNSAETRAKIHKLVEALQSETTFDDNLILNSADSISILVKHPKEREIAKELLPDWPELEVKLSELEEAINSQSALYSEINPSSSLEEVQAVQEHFIEARGVFSWLSGHHRKMHKLRKKITDGKDIINPNSCYLAYIKAKKAEQEILALTKGVELSLISALVSASERLGDTINLLEEASTRLKHLKELKQFFEILPTDYQALTSSFADIDFIDRVDKNLFDKKFVIDKLSKLSGVWSEALYSSVVHKWADEIRDSFPCLRLFDQETFEVSLKRLANFESKHRTEAVSVVNFRDESEVDSLGVELLKKEALKKRRVLSPREIMEKGALKAMLQIKPCWLMSPLSISQMLPLKKGLFDVVIFDEASQVVIENAVPAIYRGKSLVVVGDNKQMPPSNFFNIDIEEDDEELEELPESVLDLASLVYPQVRLESHYRSKAQGLISFSNQAFYESKLKAVPNAELESPFEFHQLENCFFNYKEGNEGEARAVLERLKQLLREEPNSSVGIVAMGLSQMKVLEDKLTEMCELDPELAELVERAENLKDGSSDVGLFIKNLENVQGDERDVIIISVGYAPNAPGRSLRQAFGPLSQSGGSRRLNVAVTRAKRKIILFTSFSPDDIKSSDNKELNLFASYLKFVRSGEVSRGAATKRPSTLLASQIESVLLEKGYKVRSDIGSCGFFVDLAVEKDGKYALGIECDGASKYCADYVRERDLARTSLLNSRGWKICKVSPVDWMRDKDAQIAKIEAEL